MICKNCGNKNPVGYSFCKVCGSKLELLSNKKAGFCFDGIMEYITFKKVFEKRSEEFNNSEISWIAPDEYHEKLREASAYMERKDYATAISLLCAALKLNPVGTKARSEMIECYLQVQKYNEAYNQQMEMKDFILSDHEKASYYRRLGLLASIFNKPEIAVSCYSYSLVFEKNKAVNDEIINIKRKNLYGNYFECEGNPKKQLSNQGLLLTTDK